MHTVLIVEDDEAIREALAELLQETGYLVKTAPNGLEALKQLELAGRPCLTILDLMMPVMNGWDFLAELRSSGREDYPVLVLSADTSNMPTGYPAFRKPTPLKKILNVVQDHCGPPT
jgi:CheY-like chemotaxis protein